MNEIESIHESEWHQGFNSECKEHIGVGKDGYYYALEIGNPDSDLSWHGPYGARDLAEEGLISAFMRWDERTSEQEQAWENRQIARFEAEREARPWRDLKLMHHGKCDELSRRIAIETGQTSLPQRLAQLAYQQSYAPPIAAQRGMDR